MNISICKKHCHHFSAGVNSAQGSVGGYGCQKYAVASHCIVEGIKDVVASQYELCVDDGKLSPNKEKLIEMAVRSEALA